MANLLSPKHFRCIGIRRQLHVPIAVRRTAAAEQEIVMNKAIGIIAVALSLLGSANFTMALADWDRGVTTGSPANDAAKAHQGEYFGNQ
jgi:hypothetical protein